MEYIEKRYTQPNEDGVIGLVFEPKEEPREPQETEQEMPETGSPEAESPENKAPAKQKKKV